ncbi:DNA polymerase alpha catalytic subunit-like isoform X2 [Temnothorax longispinosus]|uniref:DNA polymerase alpha catalytic subunit-like isoform X2 n=1 Tax=Temnothorax longispinosus TaxID=300112 RepID=UPI003A9939F9
MTKTLFYSQILMGKIIFNQGFVGRPICDIQVSVKELNLKVRSYDLQSLCSAVLKMKEHECKEITSAETPSFFNTVDKVLNLMHVTLKEAKYIMTIVMDLNVISLALQIICLAGNILSRTLLGRRAERNEYACNNRYSFNLGKLGLLMDFNFWYCTRCINPSIIQEYNLCFTIVPSAAYADAIKYSRVKSGVRYDPDGDSQISQKQTADQATHESAEFIAGTENGLPCLAALITGL